MMAKAKERQKRVLWYRIVSVVLVVSMLLIPVRFPETVNAAEDDSTGFTGPANYWTDDFSDARYVDGQTVKYKTVNGNWTVTDGKLEEKASSYINWLYLKVTDGNGNDISNEWTDFTTEVSFQRNLLNGTETKKGQTVNYWFRKAGEGEKTLGYYVSLSGGNAASGTLALQKYYMDGDKLTSTIVTNNGNKVWATVPTEHGTEHAIKIEAVGANIKVYYDGVLKLDWTDDGATYGPVHTSGMIGIDLHGNVGEDYSTYLDNFSVTPAGGKTVFTDDFINDCYFDGVVYRYQSDTDLAYQYKTVNGNWTVTDGKLEEKASSYINWLYLKVTDGNGNDISNEWTDFTTEVSFQRNLLNGTETKKGQTVNYWFRKAGEGEKTLGYYVSLSGGNAASGTLSLQKYYMDGDKLTSTIVKNNGNNVWATVPTEHGTEHAIKIEAVGANIKVYYDGVLKLDWTDDGATYGPVHTSGMIGIDLHSNVGEDYSTYLDNFSVTPYGGTPVVEDSFVDDRYFQGAASSVNPIGGSCAVDSGKLHVVTSLESSILVAEKTTIGGTNLNEALTDYALDVDFAHISGDAAATSLLARVNKTTTGYNYYELRVSAGKIGLYKVCDGTQIKLKEIDKTVDLADLHNMKLEVNGSELVVYFNGVGLISYTDNEDPILSGSAGLRIGAYTNAIFDNFAVYPIEAAKSRMFAKYTFDGMEDSSALVADWDVSGDWAVKNEQLVFEGTTTGTAVLKSRKSLDDYYAETVANLVENGSFSVLGRCVAAEKTYYQLELDAVEGLKLYESANGVKGEPLCTTTVSDLYAAGVLIRPDYEYTLKIQMYGNVIECFVDGILIFAYTDESPITAGVAGVMTETAGTEFAYLDVGAVDVPQTIEIMEDTNRNGKEGKLKDYLMPFEKVIEVPVGNVPDIKWLYLKATYYDGSVEYVPVDSVQLSQWDVETVGEKTVTLTYKRRTAEMKYAVIDRTEMVQQLNSDISLLKAAAELTKADKNTVYALSDRYSALSVAERELISAENAQKLSEAEEAIELLLYPELVGTHVVYKETFDSAEVIDSFYSDPSLTGNRSWGFWYVENGMLVQYDSDDYNGRVSSLETSAILKDKSFEIHSVSVDTQIIDRNVWVGIDFGVQGGERYRFYICDKTNVGGGNRIQLYKNDTLVAAKVQTDPDEFWQPGQWINLKVTYIDGMVRCYVDDVLWIEHKDVLTVTNDIALNTGSVGLNNCEGWGKFDNFIIRGVELTNDGQDSFIKDLVSDETYSDTFESEEDVEGADPSHWIETNQENRAENRWKIKADGENHVYGSNGGVNDDFAMTWLHVFETNVEYALKVRVTDTGYYPAFGMLARFNAEESFIKAGYDFTLQKYFIKVRLGANFEETTVYSADSYEVKKNDWVYLKLITSGKELQLFAGNSEDALKLVVQADAGDKVMPGRVGVYTERCDIDMDDVKLVLVSGQSHVQDGVLEYQPTDAEINLLRFQVLQLPNGTLMAVSGGSMSTSENGDIWQNTNAYSFNFTTVSVLDAQKNWYIGIEYYAKTDGNATVKTPTGKTAYGYRAYVSKDGCATWEFAGELPVDLAYYAQPMEHLNVVTLADGTVRVFYTAGKQSDFEADTISRWVISETFYADVPAEGEEWIWYQSVNSPQNTTNLAGWCESHIIMISQDVLDAAGTVIPAGTLIQYCSYNDDYAMRYSLSYDGGMTWEGDYAMPQIPCGRQSSVVKEDPYDPGTYYMVTLYNRPKSWAESFPRLRISLFKSTDGYNWDFLCDVDRWGDLKHGGMSNLMQNVNMNLSFSKDYVFPQFSRSEQFLPNTGDSHNLQESSYYRFEKSKLVAQEWPEEYNINGKDIVTIKGAEETVLLNSVYENNYFTAYYYDGTSERIAFSDAFVSGLDTSVLGEQTVTVDYKHFRTVFTVSIVAGDAPVLSVEDGKTYCGEQEVTVNDANGDLASVTLNGEAVELADGKFTVSAAEGEQTIVATDKAGNVTTIKITVNEGHTGGTATCKDKAVCEVCGEAYGELLAHQGGTATCKDKAVCTACGEAYGELDAENHTGEAKWSHTDDKHSKTYDCCGKVVVGEEAHKLTDGKCECGYEAPASGDNSQTGDNSHIVLFSGLLALSVLAAGALLIPDIRKKLFQ